jgi:glycosyltransferase involved in cell wall biosynthesis
MKILFIHTIYKLAGGEDMVVKNEIDLLRNGGYEVELLQFDNSSFSLLKVVLMPFNVFSYLKTKRAIKRFKPDIVHIHNMHFAASPSVIYCAHHYKIPVVITLHNYRLLCPSGTLYDGNKIFLDSLKPGFPWSAVRKGVYRKSTLLTFWLAFSNYLHRRLGSFKKVNAFITLGAHSRELFVDSHFADAQHRFIVKPNFSPANLNTVGKVDKSYFLFVGRLTLEKGLITLLKAFSNSKLHLKIVGTGPLEAMVRQASQNQANIEFLGQQSTAKVNALMDHAEALIFPSQWYETFGMVMIEAFSRSLPIIASGLGNIVNIVTNEKTG